VTPQAVDQELRYLRLKFEREPSDFLKGRIALMGTVQAACQAVQPASVTDGNLNECRDCKGAVHGFMVHDWVWLEAWPSYPAEKEALEERFGDWDTRTLLLLCVPCLETRLKRTLKTQDIVAISFNAWLLADHALQAILEGKP
jgi:hypothetical protein